MALHWRAEKTSKQKQARATKPSRAKRIGRRWDDRVRVMRDYFTDRDEAMRVGPFMSRCLIAAMRTDAARAFRVAGYLAKRAERKATAAKAA